MKIKNTVKMAKGARLIKAYTTQKELDEALQTLIDYIREQAEYILSLQRLSNNASKILLDLTKPNHKSHTRSHIVDHALIVSIKFRKKEKEIKILKKRKK